MTVTNNTATLALPGTTTVGTATVKSAKSSTLDQQAFLKLMTTQLKTQDPFAPVDSTQMVAQMAQFSSVAGISEMNTSLKAIASDIAGSRVGDAASWIGRSALVASDTATPLNDGFYAGEVSLPSAAGNVGVSLIDANGNTVKEIALGAQAAGSVPFSWDGKAADGSVAATGPLKVVVTAAGKDGLVRATTSTWAGISAVQSPAGGATRLVTPLGLIAPADAQRLG
ncbi:flagellar hook assembly protein FlgD [Sphingomonas profundi]|uniref:flagellar hook assembly protein FlgD n=1 Tax=Alterirhizorhabdus profundi TaxID=2681549 RepID=UPI0012E833C8|nr:flagellar hook capping FlgD N-terminal domain-containing protein [Sphingomonas profundi]